MVIAHDDYRTWWVGNTWGRKEPHLRPYQRPFLDGSLFICPRRDGSFISLYYFFLDDEPKCLSPTIFMGCCSSRIWRGMLVFTHVDRYFLLACSFHRSAPTLVARNPPHPLRLDPPQKTPPHPRRPTLQTPHPLSPTNRAHHQHPKNQPALRHRTHRLHQHADQFPDVSGSDPLQSHPPVHSARNDYWAFYVHRGDP